MQKTIIGIVLGVLVLGAVVWIARPDGKPAAKTANSASMLTAIGESSYDFGSISMAAGKVSHVFTVKNTGSETVNVRKLYTSCMCTTATLKVDGKEFGPMGMPGHGFMPGINQAILPNGEATVTVVFDPAAHGPAGVGRIQRVVILEMDQSRTLEIPFTATVRP